MEQHIRIQLLLLCIVSIFCTFAGIFFNSVVIISLWRCPQLRRKLCYFMIMVLSCVDLIAVISIHLCQLTFSVLWLTENESLLKPFKKYMFVSKMFIAFSALSLLVMNIDRYLAMFHPLFHLTSVTKCRLLVLQAMLFLLPITLRVLVELHVLDEPVSPLILLATILPALLFVNFKLYAIARKSRKVNALSSHVKLKTMLEMKNISCCVLAAGCYVFFSLPILVSIIINLSGRSAKTDGVLLSWVWARTFVTMNSTFNCLIFFWKNKMLRMEGIKVLKLLRNRFVKDTN